jgi:peptide/nickel transport system substrate-binding protein
MAPHPRSPFKKTRPGLILGTFLALFVVILSACGNSGTTNQSNQKTALTIGAQTSDFTEAGFNPFNPNVNVGVWGLVYEPLFFNNINNGQYSPLLGQSYQWNSDGSQVTVTLRSNVKWNDGQPFSSDDVLFTFNAIKQYKAADVNGDWGSLKDVTAPNPSTVVFTFTQPDVPEFWAVGSQTFIIPKHIFGSVGDITKYQSDKLVGTGPFTLGRHTSDLAVYEKNPGYWDASAIKVDEVRYPKFKDNDAFKLALPSGEIDWAGYFQSDLNTAFVQKDPQHNHYYMAPVDLFGLFIDRTKNPLLADVAVRKAISAAADREAVSKQAEAGLAPPVGQAGILPSAAPQWLAPQYANQALTPNTSQADQYLQAAGYTKGSDGIYQKNGKRLSFELISVTEYSDWNQMAQILQGNLKAAGIAITIKQMAEAQYLDFRSSNQPFELMISGVAGGPNPWYIFNGSLNAANIPPAGRNSNDWNDPQTQALLQQFAAATSPTEQKNIIAQLEGVMVNQVPYIPLIAGPRWFEYRTTHFTGWPTQSNPYAAGAPYMGFDAAEIIRHLQPVA